jgi:hypothetical protein
MNLASIDPLPPSTKNMNFEIETRIHGNGKKDDLR